MKKDIGAALLSNVQLERISLIWRRRFTAKDFAVKFMPSYIYAQHLYTVVEQEGMIFIATHLLLKDREN